MVLCDYDEWGAMSFSGTAILKLNRGSVGEMFGEDFRWNSQTNSIKPTLIAGNAVIVYNAKWFTSSEDECLLKFPHNHLLFPSPFQNSWKDRKSSWQMVCIDQIHYVVSYLLCTLHILYILYNFIFYILFFHSIFTEDVFKWFCMNVVLNMFRSLIWPVNRLMPQKWLK